MTEKKELRELKLVLKNPRDEYLLLIRSALTAEYDLMPADNQLRDTQGNPREGVMHETNEHIVRASLHRLLKIILLLKNDESCVRELNPQVLLVELAHMPEITLTDNLSDLGFSGLWWARFDQITTLYLSGLIDEEIFQILSGVNAELNL